MKSEEDKPLILMVDDDADFQTIVRGWLSPRYEHLGLLDGTDIGGMLSNIRPALILLDVRLPGPDGFALCRSIRAKPGYAFTPILFLTGCREDEDFVKNLEAGGTAYLTKPVARRRLLSEIRELLAQGMGALSAGGL